MLRLVYYSLRRQSIGWPAISRFKHTRSTHHRGSVLGVPRFGSEPPWGSRTTHDFPRNSRAAAATTHQTTHFGPEISRCHSIWRLWPRHGRTCPSRPGKPCCGSWPRPGGVAKWAALSRRVLPLAAGRRKSIQTPGPDGSHHVKFVPRRNVRRSCQSRQTLSCGRTGWAVRQPFRRPAQYLPQFIGRLEQ
jgi:hypothetical protein